MKQLFILGLELFGRNWKRVEHYVGTRTGAQVRSHAQKYFNKLKTGDERKDKSEVSEKSQKMKKIEENILDDHKENIEDKNEKPIEQESEIAPKISSSEPIISKGLLIFFLNIF